jgi:single-stranded-DNA-specific exonuclease
MKDMDKAVARISAIENQENIMVLVITMSMEQPQYLVSSYLKSYYPATYIPDRYDEGYGISFKGIDLQMTMASPDHCQIAV